MMNDVTILMAEDDFGHAKLIQRNLERAGIINEIIHFKDGRQVLDFLFDHDCNHSKPIDLAYLLLLDIRMPKVDGIEVLRQIKNHAQLKTIPVLMLTTTDDPEEIKHCHQLGCSNYITKPIEYAKFIEVIHNLGLFLRVVSIPRIGAAL
jgi:CheY-like chemotaxis protein